MPLTGLQKSAYICKVRFGAWTGYGLISSLAAQVGMWGLWGGHTSVNDLTASSEVWHRFYAVYGAGVRFLPERRLQPFISWQGGSFISQDRAQGLYTRTGWNATGVGLRARLRKGLWSPFLQGSAHRFSLSVRDKEGRSLRGIPASQAVLGLSWGAGLCIFVMDGVEFSLFYQRLRPQTRLIEGIPGPQKDRIEAFAGELLLYFPESATNFKSRFQ